MKRDQTKMKFSFKLTRFLVLMTALAGLSAVLFLASHPVEALRSAMPLQDEPTQTPIPTQAPTPVSTRQVNPHIGSDCLDCHGNPNMVGQALNGEQVSLYVQPADHQGSFHSRSSGGCTTFCHEAQLSFSHANSTMDSCTVCHWQRGSVQTNTGILVFKLPYQDVRAIALEANISCKKCHSEIFETTTDSAHTRIMQEGNRYAPVCSDCHSGHDISIVTRDQVSAVCKKCHLAEYTTYKGSVHGAALEANSNPDVPTCANCHGSHLVSGPTTSNFREQSVKICGDCHSNKSIMDKYGISTDVLTTYMDDVHGLTDWFRKTSLENITRATCFDCHGKHNILSPDNPASKVYPENLQSTCGQCHKDTNIRFPQSWLSHRRVTLKENAGLSIVNTVFIVIVVVVTLVIVTFILLDVLRRARVRRATRKLAIKDKVEAKATVKEEVEEKDEAK